MRIWMIILVLACSCLAAAQAPLPDSSPDFLAGEWTATGERGSYCYMKLSLDGQGLVLIDGGAGDWLGARLLWQNDRQTLHVKKIIPMPSSSALRMRPLKEFSFRGSSNRSLTLSWSKNAPDFHLQRIDDTERHLQRARDAAKGLP